MLAICKVLDGEPAGGPFPSFLIASPMAEHVAAEPHQAGSAPLPDIQTDLLRSNLAEVRAHRNDATLRVNEAQHRVSVAETSRPHILSHFASTSRLIADASTSTLCD